MGSEFAPVLHAASPEARDLAKALLDEAGIPSFAPGENPNNPVDSLTLWVPVARLADAKHILNLEAVGDPVPRFGSFAVRYPSLQYWFAVIVLVMTGLVIWSSL